MPSIADRMSAMAEPGGMKSRVSEGEPAPTAGSEDAGGHVATITHRDGKYHVEHEDGSTTGPHGHLHEAMAHISAKHLPESQHSHIEHHPDGTHTSHHADHDGKVSGPHDHENLQALKSHMDKFLGEEDNEWKGEDYGKGGGSSPFE